MNGVFFASVYDYRSVALSAAIALSATTLSFISYLKSDGCNLTTRLQPSLTLYLLTSHPAWVLSTCYLTSKSKAVPLAESPATHNWNLPGSTTYSMSRFQYANSDTLSS